MLGAQGWPPAQLPEFSCGQLWQSLDLISHGDTAIHLMSRRLLCPPRDRTNWVKVDFELHDSQDGLWWTHRPLKTSLWWRKFCVVLERMQGCKAASCLSVPALWHRTVDSNHCTQLAPPPIVELRLHTCQRCPHFLTYSRNTSALRRVYCIELAWSLWRLTLPVDFY